MDLRLSIVGCLLAACAPSQAPEAPIRDGHPGRRTASTDGAWEALVDDRGALSVRRAGEIGAEVPVDADVDARVAFSPDGSFLVYARRDDAGETDLWRVTLPAGAPEALTAWPGSEDRPVVSPDGRHLALVSGRTGIAAWWTISLDGALPVEPDAGRQRSNVGMESARREPGHPPAGFVAVPDGTVYAWTEAGLSWVAQGEAHTLPVTP